MRLTIVEKEPVSESLGRCRPAPKDVSGQMPDAISRIASWMTNTLNCVPDALLATNSHGDILFMNPRAEQLTGWTIDDAMRRCSSDVFHLLDRTGCALPSPLREAYIEEQEFRCEDCVLASAEGEPTRIQYTAAPIRTEDGEVVGAVVVFRECTRRFGETSEGI